MRHKKYFFRLNLEDAVEERAFEPAQFEAMGLPYMELGMPHLEALELINRWNKQLLSKHWLEV